MFRLILTRLGVAFGTLVGVSALVFAGVSILPGNAAQIQLGQQATAARVAALSRRYGLDHPIYTRYWHWVEGLLHGRLGKSLISGQPITTLIGGNLEHTAILTAVASVAIVIIAVVLGVLSALWREGWFDYTVATTTLAFLSMPEFVVGTLLIVLFATGLHVLPPVSIIDSSRSLFDQLNLIVLPALTLVLVAVGQATRMIRAAMIEVLQQDYVQSALLRGIPRWRLLFIHALPNGIDATVQIIALTIGWLVGGVVVTETLFQYPGIGSALVNAVNGRDVPTVEAATMIITAVYVLANLFAEVGIIVLNPRLRRAHR